MADFRCAAASLGRDEPLAGTASTVRAFLLVENAGPWGVDALRHARMPAAVRDTLRERAHRARVRALLVRRHRGGDKTPGVRLFAAYADPAAPWMETTTLDEPEELLDLDLEALGRGRSPGLTPTDQPVFAVCTHGRHDACCAEQGRPAAAALSLSHPEHTWEVSHIGGDRFAANVLVLPDGLYYGRVTAAAAADLAVRHLRGHIDVERLRGRSGYPFPVQVAEVAARRETGEHRRDAVRLLRARTEGHDTEVSFDVAGETWAVRVRRTPGEETHRLTCRATRDNPIPAYEVLGVSRDPRGASSSARSSARSPGG